MEEREATGESYQHLSFGQLLTSCSLGAGCDVSDQIQVVTFSSEAEGARRLLGVDFALPTSGSSH